MALSKEAKKQIENGYEKTIEEIVELTVVGDEDIKRIEELIFGVQMEVGENERIDFYEGVSAIGLPFKREGRIPFEEVEECGIDNVWSFLQDSSNPKGDIKTAFKLVTKKGLEQVNAGVDKNRGLRKADKPAVKERNEGIHNEIVRLQKEKPKLVITDNVFWSIYKIARGEKRKAGFIKDGRNLEEIYYINELITSEDLKILKEKRAEYYGSD